VSTQGDRCLVPTIIIASKNPVKKDATLRGFQVMFPGTE